MPNIWKTYKLGDIADLTMGISPAGKNVSNKIIGLPLLNGPTEFGYSNPTPKQFTNDPKKTSEIGELLFCVRGSTTGKMNFSNQKYAIGRGIGAFKGKNGYSTKYVKYLIDFYLDRLLSVTTGSTFPNLSKKDLLEFNVTSCNSEMANEIASILSAIDDKIENNLAINKTLEEMAMALYKHWFVDFGPFKDGEFVESELGLIPKGWEVKKFNDLIENIIDNRGKTPPLSNEKTDFLLLETYQLSRKNLFPEVLKDSKAKYVSEDIYNTKKWFRKGHPKFMDILFATVGNGIPNWSLMYENDGVCIAQNIVALRPKKEISSIFLRYSFESTKFLDQFDGYVITTAQPSIKLSDLNRINMLIPSNKVLDNWTELVSEYVENVYNNYKENQSLTQLRDTLLPKLISGDVRLKEFREN